MPKVDLVLLHAPSLYDFRKKAPIYGPVSDVVPSTPIFEMYPIGFMTIANYLRSSGYSVRIINVALKMLKSRRFNVERLIRTLNPLAFGLDLHWLCHAQGSLELARIVKKCHPQTPVIFGGLSASYYHQELISYPQVDYVIRGDSTEEPLRHLMQVIREKGSLRDVPNLTWQEDDDRICVNDLSYVPSNLDDLSFDYGGVINASARYRDIVGHLPFQGWLKYPIVAVLPWHGCVHNCATCGGAAHVYKSVCGRSRPAYRSPALLAQDLSLISHYLRGPIFIMGDIRQSGHGYVDRLLAEIKKKEINNDIALELFSPPSKEFLEMVAVSIPKFSIEISPESHDEEIRRAFGRDYDNHSLERSIEDALKLGCRRVDLFFMIGIPQQTPESVEQTVRYCEALLREYSKNGNTRVHPYISPLAPFLDPGSRAFENPHEYGYKLFYRTLEEHRQALLAPSWKHMLNYETKWMSRDELAASTYKAALGLNRLKVKYGLLKQREGRAIEIRIREAMALMRQVDEILLVEDRRAREDRMNQLRARLCSSGGNSSICKKKELRWPVRKIRFNFSRIIRVALARKRFPVRN